MQIGLEYLWPFVSYLENLVHCVAVFISLQTECFQGHAGISLSVRMSVYVQSISNFVLQTPPSILMLLYRKFVNTLILYWSCARGSFQPSTLYGSRVRSLELRQYLLTFSQTTNFRLFQTERVCRQLFPIG